MTDQPPRRGPAQLTRAAPAQEAGVAAAAIGVGGGLAGVRRERDRPSRCRPTRTPSQFPPAAARHRRATAASRASSRRTRRGQSTRSSSRLDPRRRRRPGAHEAGVPAYIDTKLASCQSFATPTYFDPPFAKPVGYPPGPQDERRQDDPRRGERAAPLRLPERARPPSRPTGTGSRRSTAFTRKEAR